jgi:hypothetical protein
MDATGLVFFYTSALIRLEIVGHHVINLTVEEQIEGFIGVFL